MREWWQFFTTNAMTKECLLWWEYGCEDQCPARVDIESSRSEKWNENLIHSFREVKSEIKIWFTLFEKWKVKWKCLEIEIEKWNFSRILEKFLDFVKHNHYKCCIWVLYIAHFLHMTCIISLFSRNEMWNDFWFYSFREVKVKLKCLEIERWKGWLTIAALKPSKSIEFSRNETLAGYWSGSCLDISCVNY